jgi:hypothetical protein
VVNPSSPRHALNSAPLPLHFIQWLRPTLSSSFAAQYRGLIAFFALFFAADPPPPSLAIRPTLPCAPFPLLSAPNPPPDGAQGPVRPPALKLCLFAFLSPPRMPLQFSLSSSQHAPVGGLFFPMATRGFGGGRGSPERPAALFPKPSAPLSLFSTATPLKSSLPPLVSFFSTRFQEIFWPQSVPFSKAAPSSVFVSVIRPLFFSFSLSRFPAPR